MTRVLLTCCWMFGGFAGMAQTLTSTFQFTASGYIGTPATATTPFQGQTFTNATITITASGSTANRQTTANGYCIPSDSATVSISGVGTFSVAASAIGNSVEVDPVKGVQSNSPYFSSSSTCGGIGPAATTIQGSTAWNMLTSFGPFQSKLNLYGVLYPIATTGGTLVFSNNAFSSSLGTFQAMLTGTPPPPTLTRTGVLSHIAAGGGWTTVITLVNTSSAAVPVTVAFHSDDGTALSLPVTTTNLGSTQTAATTSVSAIINPDASLLITTGQLASTVDGWADVLSTGTLGGYATFRWTPQTGSPSEGTVPLQIQFPSTVTLPYDDTKGFVMGIALANLSTSQTSVTATMWDANGNQLGVGTIVIAASGHTSFVLPNQFPATAGQLGIVQFQSNANGGIAGLGLRFSPFGTFTSVPTM